MNKFTYPLWKYKSFYEKQKRYEINKKVLKYINSKEIKGYDGYTFDVNLNIEQINNLYQPAKKLLGLYEYEIKDFLLRNLLKNKYDNLVGIGASDGIELYRISQILKINNVSLYDIEIERYKEIWDGIFSRFKLHKNGEIFSSTEEAYLNDGEQKTLAILDIEGFEFNLLEKQIHKWKNCDLIIEVHTNDPFDVDYSWGVNNHIKDKKFIPIVSEFYKSKKIITWARQTLPFLSEKDLLRMLYEQRTYSIGWIYLKI